MSDRFFKGFGAGVIFGVMALVGCASTGFPWRYYATSMPDSCYDQGKLLGATGSSGWPDLALDTCKPDPTPSPGASTTPVKLKCITVLVDDFYSLKADDLKCHSDLQACQHEAAPSPGVL